MAVLAAHGLEKSFGPQTILEDVSVAVRPRERVGLVGPNGAGKSTLARILAGEEEADRGSVSRARGADVAYLPQEPCLDPTATARSYVVAGLKNWSAAQQRYQELTQAIEAGQGGLENLAEAQADAASEVERLGGWDLLHRADALIGQLGVRDPDQTLGTVSGGEQRRVALARILIGKPALAILDEPTNHLDADTIEWLEQFLIEEYPGALLLITHDRYVLDRVVQRTLELDGGRLYDYDGGWEDYLAAKAERQEHEARTDANRRNLLRTELEWMRRQPKARTGKQKARLQRIDAARSVTAGPRERSVSLAMEATRSGNTILELSDLEVEVGGRRLVRSLTLQLTQGERIGIIGRNAIGKTTLLRCLCGQLEPAAGRIVRGKNTSIAYFEQTRIGLDDATSIQQNVADGNEVVHWNGRPLSVFSYLENFLFFGDQQRQTVGSLSGGERARVALAKLLLGRANVLLLDEPTNDLDVVTLSALEAMLRQFGGTSLVVTHDRYFLDRVATGLLVFEGDGRVVHHPGNYSTYQRLRAEALARNMEARRSPASPRVKRPSGPRRGLTYAEQRELDGILDEITAAETRVAEIEAELTDPKLYATRGTSVPGLLAAADQARTDLQRLTERWEELETRREGCDAE